MRATVKSRMLVQYKKLQIFERRNRYLSVSELFQNTYDYSAIMKNNELRTSGTSRLSKYSISYPRSLIS